MNVNIFNKKTNELDNIDNLDVLMMLEQKMEDYEKQAQVAKVTPKVRDKLLCYRCFCLKYHNRLPE